MPVLHRHRDQRTCAGRRRRTEPRSWPSARVSGDQQRHRTALRYM